MKEKKKMFLNCTQHKLLKEQIEWIKENLSESYEIRDLRDLNPELFQKLANSPHETEELEALSKEFGEYLHKLQGEYFPLFLHFPIGSPAFMFVFASRIGKDWNDLYILFSHSKRVSEEITLPDGSVKINKLFKFEKFIFYNPILPVILG